jgi:peptidoglycan-associated lipoprotein
MNTRRQLMQSLGIVSLMGLLVWSGCSTKSTMVRTSGSEPTSASASAAGSGGNAPLSGFSKHPAEEAVARPMVVAKAEPSGAQAGKAREAAAHQLAEIYFAFDRWNLSEEGKKNLTESAAMLKQHPGAKLEIDGYCDERGSREYNLVLGEKRAKEASRYLAALGITNPVHVSSFGKERPVCTEHDEACYWKNRRAHLVVQEGQ